MPSRRNLPFSVPAVDPAAVETLLCRAGLAVAVLDGSGHLSLLSPGLERLHREFEAVPAEAMADVFHLYGDGGARLLRPDEVPIVRASLGGGGRGRDCHSASSGAAAVRHLRVNATPMVGLDGERQGAWAVMTDVTSLVAAARGELNKSLAETVNHNLRTPLTTMLGHTELLLDQQEDFSAEAICSLRAGGAQANDSMRWSPGSLSGSTSRTPLRARAEELTSPSTWMATSELERKHSMLPAKSGSRFRQGGAGRLPSC